MEQDPDQAGKDDDKASTAGVSRLDFNFLNDYEAEAETLRGTTEPSEDGTSTLEPPSAFMNSRCDLPESSSPGKFKTTEMKLVMESPRRRRIECASCVHFLGTLPEEEWEVHYRDHENRAGKGAKYETKCKVLNIPMEVKKIWAKRRLMPWFRANMTAWLYEYAKKHMSNHSRVYSSYQMDVGS